MALKTKGRISWRWIIMTGFLILLEVFKLFPAKVEDWYAQGIYPVLGKVLRTGFGMLPFSMGDVMVAILIFVGLIKLLKFIFTKETGKWRRVVSWKSAGTLILTCMGFYIAFHLFWGLNYYRQGSTHLLNLQTEPYSAAEVDTLVHHIQIKLEYSCRDSLMVENSKTSDRIKLATEAKDAYNTASHQYSFLKFENISFKPILLGKLQAYAGYAGYIFPFTGEAQADFYVPNFTLPFTVCHEMAHQLGFGAESEANLIGFLAARESKNPAFVYSAYAGVHQYALVELYKMDSLKARPFIDKIPPLLKKDRLEQMRFQEAHTSFLQPALDAAYTLYLQGNNQPMGLQSYNRVVAWLVAYGKKYGWDKI